MIAVGGRIHSKISFNNLIMNIYLGQQSFDDLNDEKINRFP